MAKRMLIGPMMYWRDTRLIIQKHPLCLTNLEKKQRNQKKHHKKEEKTLEYYKKISNKVYSQGKIEKSLVLMSMDTKLPGKKD